MCDNYEIHSQDPDGMLTCRLCNTSWGINSLQQNRASWLPEPRLSPDRASERSEAVCGSFGSRGFDFRALVAARP